ncbi:MAG: RNA polymerase sigma factor [Saprospiraceae bacterium]
MKNELEDIFLAGLNEHKESLLRVCTVYASNEEAAKDLLQEALLNIWKSLPRFKQQSSLKTWMYKITVNVCLGLAKKRLRKKYDFLEIDQLLIYQTTNSESIVQERLVQLRNCISQLNETDRALITLHLESLRHKEIAEITGLTENHIAVKLKRIRTKLQTCISAKK